MFNDKIREAEELLWCGGGNGVGKNSGWRKATCLLAEVVDGGANLYGEECFRHAQGVLGECYYQGWGIPVDEQKARHLAKEAWDEGKDFAGGFRVAAACWGKGEREKASKIMKEVFPIVEKYKEKHIHAKYIIAWCLDEGMGVEQDSVKGASLYKEVADIGHPGGTCNYGYCLEFGIGVERDVAKAFEYYQSSADSGNPAALCNTANCMWDRHRHGLEINKPKGVTYYIQAGKMKYKRALKELKKWIEYPKYLDKDHEVKIQCLISLLLHGWNSAIPSLMLNDPNQCRVFWTRKRHGIATFQVREMVHTMLMVQRKTWVFPRDLFIYILERCAIDIRMDFCWAYENRNENNEASQMLIECSPWNLYVGSSRAEKNFLYKALSPNVFELCNEKKNVEVNIHVFDILCCPFHPDSSFNAPKQMHLPKQYSGELDEVSVGIELEGITLDKIGPSPCDACATSCSSQDQS